MFLTKISKIQRHFKLQSKEMFLTKISKIQRHFRLQSNDTNRVTSVCLWRKPIAFEVQFLSAHNRY